MFSMISGDWNPMHADAEFSKSTRSSQRVVHGVLGIAVSTGMMYEMGIFHDSVIAMLGYRNWNFLAPLLVNDSHSPETDHPFSIIGKQWQKWENRSPLSADQSASRGGIGRGKRCACANPIRKKYSVKKLNNG